MVSIERSNQPSITYGQMTFINAVRDFWRNVAIWTRDYLFSRYSGIGDPEVAFTYLYQVPLEFANLLQFIFGYDNAQRILQLFSESLIHTRSLIEAEIAGDTNLANQEIRQLYQLSDEGAKFLSSINPFWNEIDIKNLIDQYIRLMVDQITTLLAQDTKRNTEVFNSLLHHTDNMGDYFAQGLLNYMTYQPSSQTGPAAAT